MWNIFLINSLFILFLWACNSDTDSEELPAIQIKIQDSDMLLPISEIADSIAYVLLDTDENSFPGIVSSMKYHEGNYYLLSTGVSRGIISFDSSGNHLTSVIKPGRGPGEYNSIYDFNINPLNNTIDIYDGSSRANHIYSLKGDYLRSVKHKILADSYVITDSGNYLFYAPHQRNPSDKLNLAQGVLYYDVEKEEIKQVIDFGREWESHIVSNRNLTSQYGSSFLLSTHDDYLYEFEEDIIKETIYLDFGKYSMSDEMRHEKVEKLITKDIIVSLLKPIFTKSWFSFIFVRGASDQATDVTVNTYFCFINQITKDVIFGNKIFNDIDGLGINHPIGDIEDKEILMYYLLPEEIELGIEYYYEMEKSTGRKISMQTPEEVLEHSRAGKPVIQLLYLKKSS